ncbi:hypothetical protein IFM89_020160 [Coptis chinensis]|uniref:Replication protein A 70 kDa DNA-binding subunit B/D first OB fold domain-containing protein n=1 Tax=Coptis chinensis TaxID=261450 RepID=A0A835LMV4_9MAGN|nr:hypothetical protein IFM89_020160 [Coptis chinensis]
MSISRNRSKPKFSERGDDKYTWHKMLELLKPHLNKHPLGQLTFISDRRELGWELTSGDLVPAVKDVIKREWRFSLTKILIAYVEEPTEGKFSASANRTLTTRIPTAFGENVESAIHHLDKLHTRTDRWKIRVRVTRMWKPINSKKNCAISIEFVMLDSKGYQIHAVLFKKDFQYFNSVVKEDFVQEGSIYTLEKFDVVFAKDYSPVEHAYKIHFKEGTLVKIATEEANDISKHMFKFTEFDNIPTKASQLTFLIDVIDVSTKVGKARKAAGKLLKEVVIMNKRQAWAVNP